MAEQSGRAGRLPDGQQQRGHKRWPRQDHYITAVRPQPRPSAEAGENFVLLDAGAHGKGTSRHERWWIHVYRRSLLFGACGATRLLTHRVTVHIKAASSYGCKNSHIISHMIVGWGFVMNTFFCCCCQYTVCVPWVYRRTKIFSSNKSLARQSVGGNFHRLLWLLWSTTNGWIEHFYVRNPTRQTLSTFLCIFFFWSRFSPWAQVVAVASQCQQPVCCRKSIFTKDTQWCEGKMCWMSFFFFFTNVTGHWILLTPL